MEMILKEVREVLTVIEVNLDRNFQLLIDSVLATALTPAQTMLPTFGPSIRSQTSRMQESGETVQETANLKNELIMTLAEGASRRASEESWTPLVEYFHRSSTSGEPVEIATVQELVQKIPASHPIQIVLPSNSDLNTDESNEGDTSPKLVIVKTAAASSSDISCSDSDDDCAPSPSPLGLRHDDEDFDVSSLVSLVGSREASLNDEGMLDDKGIQTRPSWDTQELVYDSNSNQTSQGETELNGTFKKIDLAKDATEEDCTAHEENIAALRKAGSPLNISDLPSADSSLSSTLSSSSGRGKAEQQRSEDSTARQQQNVYVVQRIDQLQKRIDDQVGESGEVVESVMAMAEQMQQASARIIQTLDALHHQLAADEAEMGVKYLELVGELKRNVLSDVARGGRLQSSVSTSRSISSAKNVRERNSSRSINHPHVNFTFSWSRNPSLNQQVVDKLVSYSYYKRSATNNHWPALEARTKQRQMYFKQQLKEVYADLNSVGMKIVEVREELNSLMESIAELYGNQSLLKASSPLPSSQIG